MSLDMIFLSNYVIGMTSIMLIEAYILEKKVLSIQLDSKEDLLLLSKEGMIKKITNQVDEITKEKFIRNGEFDYKFDYLAFKERIDDETID